MKRFVILVAVMAVTQGIYAQNNNFKIPLVVEVNAQNVLGQNFNEPKTDSTRFFVRMNVNYLSPPQALVLVDGLEISEGLSSLRTDDIKSITILKDASAREIFGTRGVNGVILITTKSGSKDLIETKTDVTIGETENQIEHEADATVVETENQIVPDLDAMQLEHDYASEIETETENPFPNLKIYPNPFFGTLNFTGGEGCTLIVIAEDGVIVHTQKLINPVETIVLEHLRTGVYIFCLNNGKHTKTVRGVKN